MEKNKSFKMLAGILLFIVVIAWLFKSWETGEPFGLSTLFFCLIMLFNALVAEVIWCVLFEKQLSRPISQLKKIIIPVFILFLVVVLLVSFCIMGLSVYINYVVSGMDTSNLWDHLLQVEFPAALRVYPFVAFIAATFFFYANWSNAVDREKRLREENLIYRYRTLKAQVNPHFLFNSLNTLSEIIYVDTRKADNYIQELAGVYRYILDNEETDLISLEEEIRFVTRYFELQKVRDGSRVQLNMNIPDAGRFSILPISLQILVENALKHNSASEENPLKIIIHKEKEEYIVVCNDINKRNILTDSHGTGLSNLQERVKLITGKEMTIGTENNQFIVKLPLIRNKA